MLVVGCLFAVPAASSATALTEYSLSLGSNPTGIVSGPDGNLWFTEYSGNRVGKMSPTGTLLAEYYVGGTPNTIAVGSDGALWFTERFSDRVGRIDPTTGAVTHSAVIGVPGGQPYGITSGPDGNLWFTEIADNRVARLVPSTGAITEFFLPGSNGPEFITTGPDGNLWITAYASNLIFKMSVAGVVLASYPVPTPGASPAGIVTGPDRNIWFVESSGDKIAVLVPGTGLITEYPLPVHSGAYGLAQGPDSSLWFAENSADRIGRFDPLTHALTEVALPTGSAPWGVTVGPNSNVWFTEGFGDRVGQIAVDGALTITQIGATSNGDRQAAAGVTFIDADPAGNLAQYSGNISWGDGSAPTNIPPSWFTTVPSYFGGGFAAGANHTYASGGTYTVTVTINDVGGATASRSTTLVVP